MCTCPIWTLCEALSRRNKKVLEAFVRRDDGHRTPNQSLRAKHAKPIAFGSSVLCSSNCKIGVQKKCMIVAGAPALKLTALMSLPAALPNVNATARQHESPTAAPHRTSNTESWSSLAAASVPPCCLHLWAPCNQEDEETQGPSAQHLAGADAQSSGRPWLPAAAAEPQQGL